MSELFNCLALQCKCLQACLMPAQSQCIYSEASKGQNVSRSTHQIPLLEKHIPK